MAVNVLLEQLNKTRNKNKFIKNSCHRHFVGPSETIEMDQLKLTSQQCFNRKRKKNEKYHQQKQWISITKSSRNHLGNLRIPLISLPGIAITSVKFTKKKVFQFSVKILIIQVILRCELTSTSICRLQHNNKIHQQLRLVMLSKPMLTANNWKFWKR